MKVEILIAIIFVTLSIVFIFWARKEVKEMERNKYKKIHKAQKGGKK